MTRPLRTARDLVAAGLAPADQLAELDAVAERYAIALTPAMTELSQSCAAVAAQFVPTAAELTTTPDERADPIGDDVHAPVEGVVHRYPDRVLLKVNHNCAVYCRFCFRRETVGPEGLRPLSPEALESAFEYIARTPAIWEVIVTGGDPLVLSPRRLRDLGARLAAIPHVRIVRFHSRVPVVDPALITPELIAALRSSGKTVWVAVHANHPDELTPAARAACGRLADAGVPLVSQTVLLRGINDDAATLEALMRGFVETRIKPYYLHHGDLAPGTSHFRTTLESGQALMRTLRGDLSGLAQPTYVLDIPGGHGKSPVGPAYVQGAEVEDPNGGRHIYPPPAAPEPT